MQEPPKTPPAVTASSTDTSTPPPEVPRTPPARVAVLADVFPADDPSCPSPPRRNAQMSIEVVHERMRSLLIWPMTPEILHAKFPQKYQKMCYVIGQDLDLQFKWGTRLANVVRLMSPALAVGQRFNILYSSPGDDLTIVADQPNNETLEDYLKNHFPEYLTQTDGKFTIFDSPDHQNVEPFYRFQLSGNCFLHAPILMVWYLTLWHDTTKMASQVPLIHLSRYVRNKFSGRELFEYLFWDKGGESAGILSSLAKGPNLMLFVNYTATYEDILSALKSHGPALVTVDKLPTADFNKNGKLRFGEIPKQAKKTLGHAMLLIGIRKDENNQIFLLLQNWWIGKQLVEVRNDYLSEMAGSRTDFQFVASKLELVDDNQVYSQPSTGSVRCAQSSPSLERPYHHGENQCY